MKPSQIIPFPHRRGAILSRRRHGRGRDGEQVLRGQEWKGPGYLHRLGISAGTDKGVDETKA